jgi:hypothetical protein
MPRKSPFNVTLSGVERQMLESMARKYTSPYCDVIRAKNHPPRKWRPLQWRDRGPAGPELRTGILTGGLGTYTTFSTFSLEALSLLESGEMIKAGLYVGGSVVLSIAATIFGAYLSRNLRVFGWQ